MNLMDISIEARTLADEIANEKEVKPIHMIHLAELIAELASAVSSATDLPSSAA